MKKDFYCKDWREHLPIPVCEAHPEYNELYMKAWEIAHTHVRTIEGMPQNPYMDEGLCDTQVWIWDSCFMAQFCKFAPDVFPGVETLTNFYEILYGEGKLPTIIPAEDEPFWTNAVPGVENNIYVHIADNPPLFAWGEYENALLTADREHLHYILYEKQYLQRHYAWFESLKEHCKPRGVFIRTHLISEDIGYRWEGGCSGMDNTPRGRKNVHEGGHRPSTPDMLWIDAICQQSLSAKTIAKLFALFGDFENKSKWNDEFEKKKAIINKYYWDEADGFYYDIDVNSHKLYKVVTPASFWALTAGVASKTQAEAMLKYAEDPQTLGGNVPLISLARNDGDYYPDGRYWRGGLWLPTAYASLKGLSAYGFHEAVHNAAMKIIDHMYATYKEYDPHTIWECYSPEEHKPAFTIDEGVVCRRDFCGWSALGPISMYIEYVLGFRYINAFENRVEWELPRDMQGEIGIKRLRFGDVLTDIIAKDGICRVASNAPYTLVISGKEYQVQSGDNFFSI